MPFFCESIRLDNEVNGLLQSEIHLMFLFARAHQKDSVCPFTIIDAKNSYPRKKNTIDGSKQKMETDLTFKSIMRSDRTSFAMKERWIDLHIK